MSAMILKAYVTFAGGRYARPSAKPEVDLQGGPDWIHSERYTIEATTRAGTSESVMQGPMLQSVLEDRFNLAMHVETRYVPVYELVVASGGSKVGPFTPGTCVPWDWTVFPPPPLEPGQRRCTVTTRWSSDGRYVDTVEAMTLDDWAAGISVRLGRPIVNRTGITGRQTFSFVYSGRTDDYAKEIETQLGLELRSARGAREFLVLDRVERPTVGAN